MGSLIFATRRLALILVLGGCFVSLLEAEPGADRSRIALFEPAGQKEDTTLTAVLSTMTDSVELSLNVLQRYEVSRLPPADPAKDLDRVRAYCQKNRIDQAILGSGKADAEGGYRFRLVVYDRKKDSITTDQQGSSKGALDMFDVTDALVAALLDGLSGTHLTYGSLAVESDPAGATISVNGRDVGQAPLSLRGLPVGTVELSARLGGYEGAKATVTITDGETTSSSLTLPRSMGVLTVAMPEDAVVTIRSTAIEKKEITGPGIAMLPAGDYDVVASCPGLPGVSGRVTVNGGASTPWLPWPQGYLDVRSDPADAVVLVDGQERGTAPLVVEVEPGTLHRVELKKQDYEIYRSDVKAGAGNKVLFSGSLTAVASNPPPSVEPAAAPPATLEEQPLPRASIRIDGKFDDWSGIPPAFASGTKSPQQENLAIEKVYLAIDEKFLYVRFDIKDITPSSFAHPHNFDTDHYSSYRLELVNGVNRVSASVYHNPSSRWVWAVQMTATVGTSSRQIFNYNGLYAMKGSSLEAAFPLELMRPNLGALGTGGHCDIYASTGYHDNMGIGDLTVTRRFIF